MLTLYDFGNSVCCQKVRITLCAKALDWESVKVDLFKAEQYDRKYLELNPRGMRSMCSFTASGGKRLLSLPELWRRSTDLLGWVSSRPPSRRSTGRRLTRIGRAHVWSVTA